MKDGKWESRDHQFCLETAKLNLWNITPQPTFSSIFTFLNFLRTKRESANQSQNKGLSRSNSGNSSRSADPRLHSSKTTDILSLFTRPSRWSVRAPHPWKTNPASSHVTYFFLWNLDLSIFKTLCQSSILQQSPFNLKPTQRFTFICSTQAWANTKLTLSMSR